MKTFDLATIETPMGRGRLTLTLESDTVGDFCPDDVSGLWDSVRKTAKKLSPKAVARSLVVYSYRRGVRDPIRLVRRAAKIASLAAEGDPRAIRLAVQTATDAARGVPGADLAYKAVRRMHEAYRWRPMQTAVDAASYVPGSQAVTLPLRMLGQGAGAVQAAGSAVWGG